MLPFRSRPDHSPDQDRRGLTGRIGNRSDRDRTLRDTTTPKLIAPCGKRLEAIREQPECRCRRQSAGPRGRSGRAARGRSHLEASEDARPGRLIAPRPSTEHAGDDARQRREHRRGGRREQGGDGDPRRSLPVSNTGNVMARIVVAPRCPASPPTARPDGLPPRAAPEPAHRPQQDQGSDPAPEPRGEGGHREMLLLGAGDQIGRQRLIRSTAIQMPPIPMAVHSIQDRSAVVARRSPGVA